MLELRKMDWRDYIYSNNPVAAALISKMGYTDKERVRVKKEFLRMLVKMEEAKGRISCFLTYIKGSGSVPVLLCNMPNISTRLWDSISME
jgi:hypothetical protein